MITAPTRTESTSTPRRFPCEVKLIPDLRRAVQDLRPDLIRGHITPATGVIDIYTTDGNMHRFDCKERGTDIENSMRDVLIGLGIFKHNEVPPHYINSHVHETVSYSFSTPNRTTHPDTSVSEA